MCSLIVIQGHYDASCLAQKNKILFAFQLRVFYVETLTWKSFIFTFSLGFVTFCLPMREIKYWCFHYIVST